MTSPLSARALYFMAPVILKLFQNLHYAGIILCHVPDSFCHSERSAAKSRNPFIATQLYQTANSRQRIFFHTCQLQNIINQNKPSLKSSQPGLIFPVKHSFLFLLHPFICFSLSMALLTSPHCS